MPMDEELTRRSRGCGRGHMLAHGLGAHLLGAAVVMVVAVATYLHMALRKSK